MPLQSAQTLTGAGTASRRRWLFLALTTVLPTQPAAAHDFRSGAIVADHPYAVPSAPGGDHGFAHLRGLRNRGDRPDALLAASTPIAEQVVIEAIDASGESRALPSIALPPRSETALRHDGPRRLALRGLKQPLKDGDRFDLTLRFEHAAPLTVKVWVQTPRHRAAEHSSH